MSSPLDSLVTITLVSDANTPAQYLTAAGKVILLAGTIQVGTGGHIQGIPGLVRQGTTGLEFLMMVDVPGPSADAGPVWAQQLRADLTTALTAAHDERVLIYNNTQTIIGGAAREVNLDALVTKVDALTAAVAAIKTKVGA